MPMPMPACAPAESALLELLWPASAVDPAGDGVASVLSFAACVVLLLQAVGVTDGNSGLAEVEVALALSALVKFT